MFDPATTEALSLPIGTLVFGSKKDSATTDFVFLSVFKWEMRKGWDILVGSLARFLSRRFCLCAAEIHGTHQLWSW